MKLHVFPLSPNSRKVLFANGAIGLNLPVEIVDLQSGAQKAPEIMALNPNGKIPILEYADGTSLWESNAIVNRMAAETDTSLWPKNNSRYDIMRWQFWESCHWLPAFVPYAAKHIFGREGVDLDAAGEDFKKYAGVLDGHLQGRDWLVGDTMTTADICVSATLCLKDICQYPLGDYANIKRWFSQIEAMDAWQRAAPQVEAA